MRAKILYVMHVDWDWIRQRPHFLAEHLAEHFDMHVYCKSARNKQNLTKNRSQIIQPHPLPNIAMQRFKMVYMINSMARRAAIRSAIEQIQPDFIWITHPALLEFIPKKLTGQVIYDCMDDALGFASVSDSEKGRLLEFEKRLLTIASRVFVSSSHLAEVIAQRAPCQEKTTLIRNAFDGKILSCNDTQPQRSDRGTFTIGYFGTIAEWFDFDAISYCLEQMPNLKFEVVGPTQNAHPIEHERLELPGPVDHAQLPVHAKNWDCLIMPFQVTDLIKSVDPVKLYEYINFNKPIIAVEYEEIRRFEPFVHFYRSKEELADTIRSLMESTGKAKYTAEQRMQFLQESSWAARTKTIVETLEKL